MDQNYYADSDTYYGSGRVFGIGSGVDEEKFLRIMNSWIGTQALTAWNISISASKASTTQGEPTAN